MILQPIRFVADIDLSMRFYEALGLSFQRSSRNRQWMELSARGGVLGLHTAASADPPRKATDVGFVLLTNTPLEDVIGRLAEAGFAVDEPVIDEEFGRSLQVRDPDGLLVRIEEADPELYG